MSKLKESIIYSVILILIIAGTAALFFIKSNDSDSLENKQETIENEIEDNYQKNKYEVVVESEEGSAYDYLLSEIEKGNVKIEFEEYDFGGQKGYMIVSINDNIPDPATHFWKFQVNGEDSMVGVSDYMVKQGDVLTFFIDEIMF